MWQNQVKKSSLGKSSLKIWHKTLVQISKSDFKDLDSLEDGPIIVVASIPPSPRSIQIQELTNQVLLLQSQKLTLETEKTKAEAESAKLKAQHPSPNAGQLNELLVKSLTAEFSKILSAHDFHSSLPIELKKLPSKFNKLTDKVKPLKTQVHGLEIEVPGDLKELPTKLKEFTMIVTNFISKVAELKSLQWELPTEFLSVPNQVASVKAKLKTLDALPTSKAGDQRVPSAWKASTMPTEGEKSTNQATISQLFQRRAEKNTKRKNMNKPQHETTSPANPPIITTTTRMQSSFLSNPPESFSQPEGEQTKIDKGKKAISSKDAEEESIKSDSDDDETRHVPGFMVESFRIKKGKKREGEIRKEELINLLGLEVVNKYYNDKLQYDRYCDKMLNRRAESRITNCDVLTRKGLIRLKVYREDGTSEIIPNFKASDLHLAELGIHLDIPLRNKWYYSLQFRFQAFVTIEDLKDFPNTMLYIVQEIFFRCHQGPGLDDHARTFSSLLLAKVDYRNLNPLKQMRVIEQLSPAWLTIPSWTMSISLTEVEMKCFTSRKFTRREKDMLYVKKNKADLLGKVTSKVGIEERDIKSKELTLSINVKRIKELSYLSNKLNRTAEAEPSVLSPKNAWTRLEGACRDLRSLEDSPGGYKRTLLGKTSQSVNMQDLYGKHKSKNLDRRKRSISKKQEGLQKNRLKTNNLRTFTIGSRKELDSAIRKEVKGSSTLKTNTTEPTHTQKDITQAALKSKVLPTAPNMLLTQMNHMFLLSQQASMLQLLIDEDCYKG
ncbi:hypothetical protein Tco_1383149 [Tanacetum coccineum]